MHATRPSQSPPAPTQRSLPPAEVLQAPSVSRGELLAFLISDSIYWVNADYGARTDKCKHGAYQRGSS